MDLLIFVELTVQYVRNYGWNGISILWLLHMKEHHFLVTHKQSCMFTCCDYLLRHWVFETRQQQHWMKTFINLPESYTIHCCLFLFHLVIFALLVATNTKDSMVLQFWLFNKGLCVCFQNGFLSFSGRNLLLFYIFFKNPSSFSKPPIKVSVHKMSNSINGSQLSISPETSGIIFLQKMKDSIFPCWVFHLTHVVSSAQLESIVSTC